MTTRWKLWAVAAAAALAATSARADLLFDPSEIGPGILVDFDAPAGSGLTSPVDVGVGTGYSILFSTSGGPGSVGVAPLGAWVLGSNGDWAGDKTFAGVDGGIGDDDSIASMTFDFGGLTVQRIGGLLNYDPDFTYGGGFPLPLYMAAYDSAGMQLEDYELPVSTPSGFNEGVFYGIGRQSADIAKLVIEGPYAVVDDLTFSTPVPEPSTYAMLLAGLGLLGFMARRGARS
jgi:hypothetical protein